MLGFCGMWGMWGMFLKLLGNELGKPSIEEGIIMRIKKNKSQPKERKEKRLKQTFWTVFLFDYGKLCDCEEPIRKIFQM